MSIDFVAVDFENANSSHDSACSIGAAIVKNGKIIKRYYSLLKPHSNIDFQEGCTSIHGISQHTVINSPDFSAIYPALYRMLNGRCLAAHNVGFDIKVLQSSCESRNLPTPRVNIFDSVEMAKKAWPEMQRYRLNLLAEYFGFSFKHHNAAEDATACAVIILKTCRYFNATSLDDLKKILNKKAIQDAKNKQVLQN